MELETGVRYSIHGESYVQDEKTNKLYRDFSSLEWSENKYYLRFKRTNRIFMEMYDFKNRIREVIQKNVSDTSMFGKRTLEIEVIREPYIKVKEFITPDRKKHENEEFATYGGSATLYLNTASTLVYPTNVFDILKTPITTVFLGTEVPAKRRFFPQTYGRRDTSYKSEQCDLKKLDPQIPLRILDYYFTNDTLYTLFVAQFKPTDTVIDYNLNQLYPKVKPHEEPLGELLDLLRKQRETIVLDGVAR